MGLGAAALGRPPPSLITCTVCGYGTSGPWADRKAYDLLVQCQTGLLSLTGAPTDPPARGSPSRTSPAGMYAYSGILTALFTRATTGGAPAVEVSLFEALAEWMSQPAYYTALRRNPAAAHRRPARHDRAVRRLHRRRRQGRDASIQNEREWDALCVSVLGLPGAGRRPPVRHRPGPGRPPRGAQRDRRRAVRRPRQPRRRWSSWTGPPSPTPA